MLVRMLLQYPQSKALGGASRFRIEDFGFRVWGDCSIGPTQSQNDHQFLSMLILPHHVG